MGKEGTVAGGSSLKYNKQGRLLVMTFHQKLELHEEARTENSRLRVLLSAKTVM